MNDDSALTTVFVNRKATKRKLRKSRIVVEDGPEKGTRLDIASERVTIGSTVAGEEPFVTVERVVVEEPCDPAVTPRCFGTVEVVVP